MDTTKSEWHINKGFQAVIVVSQCSIATYLLYRIQPEMTEYSASMCGLYAIIAEA